MMYGRMNKIKSIISSNTITISSVKRYLSHSKNQEEATNTNLAKVMGGVTAAFIVSLPIVAYGLDYYDQWKINETLLEGQNIETHRNYYERKDVKELLSSTISPSDNNKASYYIISGVKGCGKTAAIRHFTKTRYHNKDTDNKGGVIFVSFIGDNDFGKEFADAISYSTIYDPSLLRRFYSKFIILPRVDRKNSNEIFYACQKKFYHAVKNYKKITGKTPTLIIDNVNYFNNESGKLFLQMLLERAKNDADKDILKFVFITSDDGDLEFLERRSFELEERDIVLPDMTDEDAFIYIETTCKDNLKKYDINEVKQMIRDVVGGRIIYLWNMVLEINEGRPLKELKQKLLISAGHSFCKSGMATPSDKVYGPFWKVAKLLLACEGERKMIDRMAVTRLVNDKEISFLLRNSDVFYCNHATDEIGFHSRAIQYYLQQKSYCTADHYE